MTKKNNIPMYKTLDIVEITNKELVNEGLFLNTKYVVAAVKALPVSEDDPYTQRIKLFVQKLTEDERHVEGNVFVVDPTSVKQTGYVAVDDDASSD